MMQFFLIFAYFQLNTSLKFLPLIDDIFKLKHYKRINKPLAKYNVIRVKERLSFPNESSNDTIRAKNV